MKNRRSRSHAFLSFRLSRAARKPGVCAAAFLVLALAAAALPGVAAALTASFHGAPEAHDGRKLFVFEIRFSEDFDGLRLGALKRALEVTGGRVVDVKRTVRGENGGVTVRVRPASSGDLTIMLADGIAGGGSLTVPGPATASLPDPATPPVSAPEPLPVSAPTPLTASFHGAPEAHDGRKLFAFEIRFSEAFDGLRLGALRQALEVTGGRLVDVKRTERGENGGVTVRVRPASSGDMTITLAAGIAGGGSLTVPGPATVSLPEPATPPVSAPDPPPALNFRWYVPAPRTTPQRSASTVTSTTTSAPAGLPSGDGTVVNMNTFGIWGIPAFTSGQYPNNAPDISVRQRQPAASYIELTATCHLRGEPDNARTCSAFGYDDHGNLITPKAFEKWLTYPSDAGADDMKVHVHLKRAGQKQKASLFHWVDDGWPFDDFFVADSFLETPAARTAVQPAAMGANTTGTWAGHAIAVSSEYNTLRRGDLIGGDASITVNFGTSTTADVNLTNLESTEYTTGSPLVPITYDSQAWSGLAVTGGSFSSTEGNRTISGTFRDENDADFTQDTVGGVFKVNHVMTGGFVAKRTQ